VHTPILAMQLFDVEDVSPPHLAGELWRQVLFSLFGA
jgi:hypothetical protein